MSSANNSLFWYLQQQHGGGGGGDSLTFVDTFSDLYKVAIKGVSSLNRVLGDCIVCLVPMRRPVMKCIGCYYKTRTTVTM